MDQEQIQFKVCRTCLKKIGKREKMLSIHKISSLLMSYTSLNITENDGLPSNICSTCHKRADQAYKFKTLCEESDQKLRSKLFETISSEEVDANSCDSKLSSIITVVKEDIDSDFLKLESCFDELIEDSATDNDLLEDELQSPESDNFKTNCDINYDIDVQSNDEQITVGCRSNQKKKQLNCRFCDMTFTQQTRLLRHEAKHENGIKCYICDKSYSNFKQLRSHINIHNRKGAHLCQTCGKQFTFPENLVRHQRIHTGVRPYKCKLCNKSFTQSNELKSHMITHSSEKTHLCNVCGNKYARQMSLQVHMRRMHSDASIIRPYLCKICNRAFKDKRDLSQHISIHKGERKHVCKICSKAFNRNSNLKVHERIHSGCRPFVCHICQKSFIQKHVLNTHLRTHPGT